MVNTGKKFFNEIHILLYLLFFRRSHKTIGLFVCFMKINCLYVICSQKNYDKTVDPQSFSGKIGKLLALCENLPIVKFESNANFSLDIEPSDLSTDKMYLYEICYSVSSGIPPESLVNKHPASTSYAC